MAATTRTQDGLTYYFYELFSPYAKTGAHSYTACTVKVGRGLACRVRDATVAACGAHPGTADSIRCCSQLQQSLLFGLVKFKDVRP